MKHITEKTFFHYIKCPSWVYFAAQETEKIHDELLDRLIDDGLLPEAQRAALADRPFVEVEHEDQEEAFQRTLQLMKSGEQTILGGVLIYDHWVGHPDVLEKVEGTSDFGDYYYVAADIKRTHRLQDAYQFQGAFYAEILERIQGLKPVNGYVMNPDGEVMEYPIESFEAEFHLTLDAIERILAGKKPPHFLTSSCKQSPWFHVCKDDSVSCNDLSLINRIWRSEVRSLEEIGVKTIQQLAAADATLLGEKIPGVTAERLHWIHMQAVSLLEKRIIVMNEVELPRSKTEFYFDIESDPLRNHEYLFGVVQSVEGKTEYHEFFAETVDDEKKTFTDFINFMKRYPTVPVYHYGWFEINVLRRLGAKYGLEEETNHIIENQMIDLLLKMRDSVSFPLHFYSLKDIAQLVGFRWREETPSGINAIIWYEDYLAKPKKELKKRMLAYNEDDCLATLAVKQWIDSKMN